MKTQRMVPVAKARDQLPDLVERAWAKGERTVLTKHGRPVAVLVSLADLAAMDPEALPLTLPSALPFLTALGWQLRDVRKLAPSEQLALYERNWDQRGVFGAPQGAELDHLRALAKRFGSWLDV